MDRVNDYSSFLSSVLFKIIGPNGRTFFAHGDLLSQHSEVLAAEVGGDMLEAIEKSITIKDIDEDIDDNTVLRFLEYAYTEDYTEPLPVAKQSQKPSEKSNDADNDDGLEASPNRNAGKPDDIAGSVPIPSNGNSEVGTRPSLNNDRRVSKRPAGRPMHARSDEMDKDDIRGSSNQTQKSKYSQKERMRAAFNATFSPIPRPVWQPYDMNDPDKDNTETLLAHAKVYIFASRYDCENLLKLALQKLHLTLVKYTVTERNVAEIIQLLQYIYTHTQDYESGIDKLRESILKFITCHFEVVFEAQALQDLLYEEGVLSKELMSCLRQRLD